MAADCVDVAVKHSFELVVFLDIAHILSLCKNLALPHMSYKRSLRPSDRKAPRVYVSLQIE